MAKKKDTTASRTIWMIAREYDGLAGAGGVKDVVRQLSEALVRAGHRVSVVLPLYGFMDPQAAGFASLGLAFEVEMNYAAEERRELVRIFGKTTTDGGELTIYLLDAQRYLEKKSVYTYTAEDEAQNPFHAQGSGHYDYFAMNILLQKAALALMLRLGEKPEVIHCHDGHAAALAAMLREVEGYRHFFAATPAVVTVHNAGIGYHQEVGDLPFAEAITGLPRRVIDDNVLDASFDPLLAASAYAPLNAVSENYARELRETDADALTGMLGHRLLARGVELSGITNGINPADFNPENPKPLGLPAAFSPRKRDLAGKRKCRAELVKRLRQHDFASLRQIGTLTDDLDQPLFTCIGRLTTQKGMDKLLGALETLLPLDQNFQVVILGTGSRDLEGALAALAGQEAHQGRVCVLQGYEAKAANLIYAAGDFFLVPSQYEPCGLTDYIAQLFGNLPVVHHVGGLVKVKDGVTGFAYQEHKSAALMGTMQKALRVFRTRPEKILDMQQAAVQHIYEHYTWDAVLHQYLALYDKARNTLPAP